MRHNLGKEGIMKREKGVNKEWEALELPLSRFSTEWLARKVGG